MKIRHIVSVVSILSSSAVSAANIDAASNCMHPREIRADQIRFVDTQLRIAALQCVNAGLRDMTGLYNDFARSKRPYFIEATKPLRNFLKRTQRGKLDHYVVSMANRLSLKSAEQTQFCERSKFAMTMSAKMPNPVGLITLMPISYRQPLRTCVGANNESLYR